MLIYILNSFCLQSHILYTLSDANERYLDTWVSFGSYLSEEAAAVMLLIEVITYVACPFLMYGYSLIICTLWWKHYKPVPFLILNFILFI